MLEEKLNGMQEIIDGEKDTINMWIDRFEKE